MKTKTKTTKTKTKKIATRGVGRPAAKINLPVGKKFTIAGLAARFRVTEPTIANRVKKGLKNRTIKLAEKRITSESGLGQPKRFWVFTPRASKAKVSAPVAPLAAAA